MRVHAASATNPTTLILAGMLRECTLDAPARSMTFTHRIGTLLELGTVRIRGLLRELGTNDAAPADRAHPARRDDARIPSSPVQPPPPPQPDVAIEFLPPDITSGDEEHGGLFAHPESGAADPDEVFGTPTSWVPVPGIGANRELALRIGTLLDRVRIWLDEAGVTRGQLVALTVIAPILTALVIQAFVDR